MKCIKCNYPVLEKTEIVICTNKNCDRYGIMIDKFTVRDTVRDYGHT